MPDTRPDDRESAPPSGTDRDTDNSAYKVRLQWPVPSAFPGHSDRSR